LHAQQLYDFIDVNIELNNMLMFLGSIWINGVVVTFSEELAIIVHVHGSMGKQWVQIKPIEIL
jgi:hypothetical protein